MGPPTPRYNALDSAELLAYECSRVPMEAAKIYFIIFGVLTIAGGIVGYVKAGACWNNVGPERNWGHCGHRRLGKKVIAWEEFAFGRGDGLCLSYSPRFSLRLFTAGYHSSGYNASRPLSYLPRQHRNRRQPGRR